MLKASVVDSVTSFLGFKQAKHKDAPSATVSMSQVDRGGGSTDAAVAKQKETLSRMQPAGPNATAIHDGWGVCDTETVDPTLKLKVNGDKWEVESVDFHGNYSKIVTLIPGIQEIGGPGVDTTDTNYKKQQSDLRLIAEDKGVGDEQWYMWAAVDAHEGVHESRLLPALTAVAGTLAAKFTSLTTPSKDTDQPKALQAIKSKGEYATAVAELRNIWDAKYVELIGGDHAALTPAAEHKVVDPMIAKIGTWAKTEGPEKPPETKGTGGTGDKTTDTSAPQTAPQVAPQVNAPTTDTPPSVEQPKVDKIKARGGRSNTPKNKDAGDGRDEPQQGRGDPGAPTVADDDGDEAGA